MNERFGSVGAPVAALLASACCIGPALSAGLGIGAVAAAQSFAPLRPLFLVLTTLFLGLGFYFAYRKPKHRACQGKVCEAPRISRWSRPILWIATVMVAALAMFPYYYGPLRAAFGDGPPDVSLRIVAAPAAMATPPAIWAASTPLIQTRDSSATAR